MCLAVASACKASDPRDLVYGVLGVADKGTGIQVDYSLPVEEVYARTTIALCREEQNMNSLIDYRRLPHTSRVQSWSWILDVPLAPNSTRFITRPPKPPIHQEDVAKSWDWQPNADPGQRMSATRNGSCLLVNAVRLDRIIWAEQSSRAHVLCTVQRATSGNGLICLWHSVSTLYRKMVLALAETLGAESYVERTTMRDIASPRRRSLNPRVFYEPPFEGKEEKVAIQKVATYYSRSPEVQILAEDRYFFVTELGRLGIADKWPDIGSEVALIDGIRTPVVLQDAESHGHYELLTGAWVQNMMHGQMSHCCEGWRARHQMEQISLV